MIERALTPARSATRRDVPGSFGDLPGRGPCT